MDSRPGEESATSEAEPDCKAGLRRAGFFVELWREDRDFKVKSRGGEGDGMVGEDGGGHPVVRWLS